MHQAVTYAYLVVREDERVRYHDVLAARGSEDNDFGDVVRGQGFAATVKLYEYQILQEFLIGDLRIDCVGLGLVTVESHDGEVLKRFV